METPIGLAMGSGGKPLGTERLSALPSSARLQGEGTGQVFAEEVERALERSRGEGLQADRLVEQRTERRANRHAGFDRERAGGTEGRPTEADFREEHGAVAAQPAGPAPIEGPRAPVEAVADPSCSDCGAGPKPEGARAPDSQALPGAQTEGALPVATPLVGAAASAQPRGESLALPATPKGAPAALPAVERAGVSLQKAGASAAAPEGPDPALLERAEEILRQIKIHARAGVTRITLDLEPVDLGRLSVQLALRAGKITAIVRAENPETLGLLEQHENALMQLFSERGIETDSLRFELGFGRPRRSGGPGVESSPGLAAASTSTPPERSEGPRPLHPHGKRPIDTYA